jgi:hypothetical protein
VTDSQAEEAAALAEMHQPDNFWEDEEFDESDFAQLPDPPSNYDDWSANRRAATEEWLNNYKERYYAARTRDTLDNIAQPLELFSDPGGLQYHPSECHNYQQKLLVGCCLYQLKVFEEYRQSFCPDNQLLHLIHFFSIFKATPELGRHFASAP